MIRFFLTLILLSTFGVLHVIAQEEEPISIPPSPFKIWEDSLENVAHSIVNERNDTIRFASNDAFMPLLREVLSMENSYEYTFDSLRSVSVQTSPDEAFRIFTWQLYVDVNDYRYFGLIQKKDDPKNLIILSDKSAEVEDLEYDILNADSWYGVFYYNIKPFKTKQGTQYLLFGYDGYSLFNKRKIIDVLSFENGQPVFGADVFAKKREGRSPSVKRRIYLEYSVEISINLNFNEEMDMVIFDHLISVGGTYPGQGPTMVTDGSYEGYKLKKGQWWHVDKIFHQVSEEAPRPQPILDSRSKDIHGN